MEHNTIIQPNAPPPSGANYSAEHGCFEGPEKLLEIWFSPTPFKNTNLSNTNSDSEESTPNTPNDSQISFPIDCSSDLRTVDRALWDSMLATVKCTVLNVIRNDHVDAYLLSESSMFVYPHKIILKTCGTTTLLKALPYMLEIAKTRCGYDGVYRLFYSRKSYMFPDKQPGPHRSWEEEVYYLNDHFDNGASYVIGDENSDEWYLYLTLPDVSQHQNHIENITDMKQLMKETDGLSWMNDCAWYKADDNKPTKLIRNSPSEFSDAVTTSVGYRAHDETIEILMTKLSPEAMKAFYHRDDEPSGLEGGNRVDLETGLDQLYPEAEVDAFLFEPCGYSCNGLLNDGYYTIHVTPEPQCSYASFETTIPVKPIENPGKNGDGREEAVRKLIRQVVDIFQPGAFTVTYFSSCLDTEQQAANVSRLVQTIDQFGGYKRKDKTLREFEGYDLVFGHYIKM
ncbi:adenosylmethionine decarboxylase [Sporodiniella umbellata]|nr:adenosylmethionine decarboxylase [Sporodiniella umbellata]